MATREGRDRLLFTRPGWSPQGIALVTFPAASTIFTEPSQYGLSSSQYGTMFVPQVVTAVTTGLLGAGRLWADRVRAGLHKARAVAALPADLAAMMLLIVSWFAVADQPVPGYGLLLAATACLGAGSA